MIKPYACMRCMAQSDDTICPVCGAPAEDAQRIRGALAPQTILNGKYLVGAALGGGGFGVTYRALKLSSLRPVQGETVAVKEYFPRNISTRRGNGSIEPNPRERENFDRWRSKFVQEYRMLHRMEQCPSVVHVLDIFEENNTAYLVMEYVEGTTIEKRVREQGPIPAQQLLKTMEPFINDMYRLNERNVVHRDMNPSNIILRRDAPPMLIDFGSARPNDPETKKTVLIRKGYAPPEQYDSDGRQGAWTDVYGLCATLYFALTGVEPPDARERRYDDRLQDIGELCPALSRRQANVLMAGLEMDYTKRPASFESLAAGLYYVPPASPEKPKEKSAAPVRPIQRDEDVAAALLAARRAARLAEKLRRGSGAPILNELDRISRLSRLDEQAENLNRLLSESRPWFRVLTKLMRRK